MHVASGYGKNKLNLSLTDISFSLTNYSFGFVSSMVGKQCKQNVHSPLTLYVFMYIAGKSMGNCLWNCSKRHTKSDWLPWLSREKWLQSYMGDISSKGFAQMSFPSKDIHCNTLQWILSWTCPLIWDCWTNFTVQRSQWHKHWVPHESCSSSAKHSSRDNRWSFISVRGFSEEWSINFFL